MGVNYLAPGPALQGLCVRQTLKLVKGVRSEPSIDYPQNKEYPKPDWPDRRATFFNVAMSQKIGSPGGRAFRARWTMKRARLEWTLQVSEHSEDSDKWLK